MLDYRVLGGFAVESGGNKLDVGGPRQRRLAVLLLVNRHCVVSADRLADVVFAGKPAAASTLRSYIARLRRVVEFEGSGCMIVTQAPGYRFEVADQAVDAARFEAALARGRSRLAHGDATGAADALRDGLGLWRGEAYAEFADEDWVLGEAQRLSELRLVAYEGLADAELASGRPGEAVSLLDGLVADHPLRESFQARMMLALYRSGRQVEALRAYQAHRQVLGAELGLDPSPELVELEGRILAHDQALAAPEAGGVAVRGYRLGDRLGTGRDGTVFAARSPGVERDIVVRVVPESVADGPDFVRTFDADAHRVAALHHDAVVPIHDWWREPGAAYVVMRRLRGGTLRDRLRAGPLGADAAAEVVARVGGALVAASEAGTRHGRVTAESVLFDEAGAPYLGDFPLGTSAARDGPSDLLALAALACQAPGCPVPALRDVAADVPGGPASPQALAAFVTAATAALAGAPAVAPTRRANPYKGLRAFDEPDAGDFFGRDRVVDELVARLAADGPSGRFALVVGASGSGKSSLVRAGLLPRARSGAIEGSARWFVATMTPGRAPFDELADALRPVAVGDTAGLAAELAGPGRLVEVVGRHVPPDGELLLVVDQLEELFTLAPEADQRAFVDALATAIAAPEGRLRVVATLRADYYDRPLGIDALAAVIGDATVAVGLMSPAELEAAIVGPAERVGMRVEPALIAELVGAVAHEPAGLPPLQFTLAELADRSDDGVLTLDAYRALGGVTGAIAARAEDLYLTLSPDARLGVRRMFEQLVALGPEGAPTRRRALVGDVAAVLPVEAGDGGGRHGIVEVWARARLLTLDRHPDSRAPTVEVAHEALLREWPRLRDWVEEDRREIVALAELREAAAGWEALGRDPSGLYRGVRLEAALQVAESPGRTLPPADRTFLDASRAERDAERRREAGRVRRLRAQLVVVAAALVVSLVIGAVAVGQRNRAAHQGDIAGARELAAAANANLDVDPERSVLLALEAVDRSRGEGGDKPGGSALPEAEEALHNAVAASRAELRVPQAGGAVDWSPDGDTFVTEGPEQSGDVDIRDAETGESVRRWQGHDPDVNQVAYGPNGSLLLTTGDDGDARLWDPGTGEQVQVLEGDTDAWGPSISTDGTLFAAAWPLEGFARVAEVATGRVVREVRLPEASDTAFSPDGGRIGVASWGGGPSEVVDIASGEVAFTLAVQVNAATDIAWSPDGASIATAGYDGSATVWDAATGEQRFALLGHQAPVNDVDWNPDGRWLATAGGDGTAKLWLIGGGGGTAVMTLTAQDMRGGVMGVAFSPDGGRLLTGDIDIVSARVWGIDTIGDGEVATVPSLTHNLNSAAFLPGGRVIAPVGGASLALWDLDLPTRVRTFGGNPPPVTPGRSTARLRAGPVEPALVTADASGTVVAAVVAPINQPTVGVVHAWDVASGRRLFGIEEQRQTVDLAWSPDGRYLAVSARPIAPGSPREPGRVVVYADDGRRVAELVEEEGFGTGGLRFTDDGRRLVVERFDLMEAAGATEHGLQVWDWRREEVVGGFDVPGSHWVTPADGGRLAAAVETSSTGDLVSVWDVPRGRKVADLGTQAGDVQDVAFSPDGTTVAIGTSDGTVSLRDARGENQVVSLRGHVSVVSSMQFSEDGSQLMSAGADGAVRIWALRLDDLEDIARDNVTRGLTTEECRRYLHEPRCPG